MALTLKLVIISAIYFLCTQINDTDANHNICNLDHMKRYALNSCEMLIEAMTSSNPNPHSERLKRELLDSHNSTTANSSYNESRHVDPIHLRIKSRLFPAGGYIVLDHLYAKVLRQNYPKRYHVIPKSLFSRHNDNNETDNEIPHRRRKRHHGDGDKKDKKTINVTYCCMNQCKPYDLCEL